MGTALIKLFSPGDVQAMGSVLDRVISQPSTEEHTVLYKLADYKKGGLLLETYTKGGMIAAERLIREEFSAYMYAGGRGRVINRAEYLRWKFRDQEQVVLPIEASLSPYDPLAKWEDHVACWQMSYRGALGESLLHLLIICDTKIHTRLARTLVKCFPKLSLDVVEGEEYLGASALHLAIAYSNNELVQDLVEAGADVSQRAIGSFFLPRDQQCVPPSRHSNYEGLAYLGEYPLAWAACCANEAVYNLLLDSGADPDSQDSFGNMILHMVVVCDKLDMFGYALRHPKVPASNGRVNHAGFTPLTLACQLGRASVFREMLELSAREFWRYSNITCSAYPLNALDTLLPDGKTNWNSALFIILNGTKQEHLNMLDGGIIQRLLEEKWKTFARQKFLKRLMIFMLHLLLLSVSVYLRHSSIEADANPNWGLEVTDARGGIRLASELGTILSTLCYIILQQGDEIKNQGLVAYFKQLIHEPAKFIFLASNLLLLACIPARLSRHMMVEEAILIFVLPGSWFLLMFFAGAVKLTGPFVTMIYSMITGDMFTFGIIYSIVLFGFSQSFYFLYKGFPNVQSTLFSSFPSTWMALFQITLGDYSYTDLGMTIYPNLAKAVFALFMVFVPILLLNMLIAMMGNTYAHVIEQSEKEWVKQWAKIVVALEQSVAQEDAHRYLQEYSIGLGPSDDPRYEQRAVMVIKSKAKTRAKQRKGALANWKRVGKVTIAELRKRGISGEELRRLMWGRASISTPTKAPLARVPPPPDCVAAAEEVLNGEVGNGVGSALSSALNVMAFTHELDLNGQDPNQKQATPDLLVNGQTLPSNVIPSQVQSTPNQLTVPSNIDPNISLTLPTTKSDLEIKTQGTPGVNIHVPCTVPNEMLPGLSVQGLGPQMQSTPVLQPVKEEVFRDYLLELILLAEKTDPSDRQLKSLAEQAANLEHIPVIDINTSTAAKSTRKMVAGAVSGLFGVAADAPAPDAGWRRERQEQSDSDPISESVLLGRASRARRARSASRRAAPPPPHLYVPARSMYLVASESSAVEDEPPWEDQLSSGNNSAMGASRDESARMRAARPLCIQHATGQAQVEHSLFITGPGSGPEVESAAPLTTVQKNEKRTRPKTARPRRNRVSPVPEASSPLQHWATAPLNKLSRFIHSGGSSTSLTSHTSQDSSTKY
ncbi:Transient receptor potential cation channel subfamily V member 6 [Papilio xuthus]|uniref:Transient receptor potential cation channel subfamily V member 6 n=1 Tax=Papilio xuthus TaxID=66420 RepID=A0A194Q759_PAPXU|nr:Transient receptor potential cation channel subfamily V member 6 [Papilio xuthus]